MAMSALAQRDGRGPDHGRRPVGGGLETLCYLLYYPALAMFAVAFASFRISFAWVTMAAALYSVVVLVAGEGLDFAAKEEKVLIARIAAMYGVVVVVNLVSRFERIRRAMAVQRERELHRERIELSQTIHDTVAQSAYMIGLGIESAIAGGRCGKQGAGCEAHGDARTVEGVDVGTAAPDRQRAHLQRPEAWRRTRRARGGLHHYHLGPVDVVQSGTEPPLPAVTRGLLFSIAHNAMTNAMRHASADRVTITLDFGSESLRMSISDDGVGLPPDFAQRGHGFRNMRRDAGRMGGKLEVRSDGPGNGTTVTCVAPYDTHLEDTN